MKRFMKLLSQAQVKRTIIYSSISKIVIALIILFLWDKLVNQNSVRPLGVIDTGFFALALWFIIGAWIQYLALDGFRPFPTLRLRKKERRINAWAEEELEEDELQAAKFCSNVIAALTFLIPSLIATVL